MKIQGAGIATLLVCLVLACGSSSGGSGDGGGGSGGGGAGGGGTGAGGTSSGSGGAGGATGGDGGLATCAQCIACVQSSCASQVTQCQANTSCNAILQCAMRCDMHLDDCIAANTAGVLTWGPTVAACANQNCTQNGCPY